MSTEKELSVIRFKRDGVCDVNAEVTLEDYKTEIKRILCCKETLSAPSKYTSKNGIELEGNVRYRLLYVGTDNRLYSTEHSEEYEISCSADGDGKGDNIRDLTAVWSDGVSVRLLSPRKFSLKNKICSRSAINCSPEKEECVTERFIPTECESLTSRITTADTVSIGGDIIELCDEYIPRSDTERVIFSDCSIFISDVHADDGRITARGELVAEILACDEEGFEMPHTVRRKIPFTQETEHPDVRKGCRINALGTCTELKVTPEDSRVLINAYCSLEYTVACMSEERVCTDAFSPERTLKLTEGKLRFFGSVSPQNGNLSISTSIPLSELGIAPSRMALTACGTAYVTDFTVNSESGKGAILGECKFSAVFLDDTSDIPEYEAKDISVPFRYEFPFDTCGAPALYCHSPSLSRISLRSDGEKAALDCELSLSFIAVCENEISVISDITQGDARVTDESCIRILYPQKGETLWSLAKSTSTKVKRMCEINGLSLEGQTSMTQSLENCKFIII